MTSPYADVPGEDVKTIFLFFNSVVSHLLPLSILSDGSQVLLWTRGPEPPSSILSAFFLVFIPPPASCIHRKIRRLELEDTVFCFISQMPLLSEYHISRIAVAVVQWLQICPISTSPFKVVRNNDIGSLITRWKKSDVISSPVRD